MKYSKYILTLCCSLFMSTAAMAESFQDYVQSEMKAFNEYKDALDKEFSDYLNQPWKDFKSVKSKPKLDPKPKKLKPVKKVEKELPVVKEEVKVPVIKKAPPVEPVVVAIPKVKVTPKTVDAPQSNVTFYGHKLFIKYKNPLPNQFSTMINQEKMKVAWDAFAKSEYVELLDQVQSTIEALNLNDWGRMKLLEKIGQAKINGKDLFRNRNEIRLFTWFAFTKLKYDIKVGFTRQHVVMLTPINTMVYSTMYFTIDNKRYFAIDFANSKTNLSRIRTYEKSHPKASEVFDLRIEKRPKLKQYKATKRVAFNFNDKDYSLDIDYDKVYVAYYKNYPQVAYPNYFKAPVSPLADASFRNEVAKLIEGKGEVEAVNLLLRLVQKGFEYQIDETQFQKEKVMLPEETLYYPFSDCEDRAILFSKLVRDLLGLEVVGIKFPAHLATAVALKSRLSGGTSFVQDGKRYYMADPTYMGADVGMMPPRYKGVKFEVIHAR